MVNVKIDLGEGVTRHVQHQPKETQCNRGEKAPPHFLDGRSPMEVILKYSIMPIICVVSPDDVRGVVFGSLVQEAQHGAGDYHATYDNPTRLMPMLLYG